MARSVRSSNAVSVARSVITSYSIHYTKLYDLVRGDEATGLTPLREGLRIGREKGYIDVYLWRPGMLETVAAKAMRNNFV